MKRMQLLAGLAACAFAVTSAKADIQYISICGNVTVDGVLTEGVKVQAMACDGARLPSDWPEPPPSTMSGAHDPQENVNYHLEFTSQFGTPAVPGPDGSFTFISPFNGAWFTAIDVKLVVSIPDCPPVIVSCEDVRLAYDATADAGLGIGKAVIDINIDCPEFPEGTTATIGFWQNKNGQKLIKKQNGGEDATDLATWLSSNYPYCWGANAGDKDLTGKDNADVAALFEYLFDKQSRGPKHEAQMLGAAFAVYVTDSDLAGDCAEKYGFIVNEDGTGILVHNVGEYGSKIGLVDDMEYTVLELLSQANLQKQLGTYDAVAFNDIFSRINEAYDRD